MITGIRLDPRTKLITAAIFSTLAIVYSDLRILAIILLISFITAISTNKEISYLLSRLKGLLILVAGIAVIQSLFTNSGIPLLKIGEIVILTDFGASRGIEFLLRMGIIASSSLILVSSSSREMIQGMIKLRIPYEIAFMVSVGVRFFPVFREEFIDMTNAIQLRGLDFKKIGIGKKLRAYTYLLMPITVNSLIKAKELSVAMEARSFRAYPTRTSWVVLRFGIIDYIVLSMALVFVMLIALLG